MPRFERTRTKTIQVKDHVINHRAKYAVAATIIVMGKAQRDMNGELIDFLKTKNLWDEFADTALGYASN